LTDGNETKAADRRWAILAVVGLAQLMVVLDVSIVNIALPSAQADLGFSDSNRQWIVTGYALAFGALLLVGGKIGDHFGRKWALVGGLSGFAVASALGGAAPSFEVLLAARVLQGAFGALLAPAALSTLTNTFSGSPDRGKAFGIYGAIAGAGGAVGLLLGGALTEYLSWRWCMYVNLLFAIPAVIGALILVVPERVDRKVRVDFLGGLLVTSGLFALVFGLAKAETDSWSAAITIISLIMSVVLLVGFVLVERRITFPLLPLSVVTDRLRGTAFATLAIMYAGLFSVFLFLTYYLQQTLGFSPLQTGLGFLPMVLTAAPTATIVSSKLLNKLGPGPLMPLGMALSTLGFVILSFISVDSSYWTAVLPALIPMGIGVGLVVAPGFATGTLGVARSDAGVASAMVTVCQQVGGALGTALFSTIAVNASKNFLTGAPTPEAMQVAAVHGYTTAFWAAAIAVGAGAVMSAVLLRGTGTPQRDDHAATALAH
jgi:EmrB/QacA subfamily drug resistance transporter